MRIAMVGARFAGLDGVSLESAKIAEALERVGHQVYWFAGELGPEFTPGIVFAPASFNNAANSELQRLAFSGGDPEFVRVAVAKAAQMIMEAFEEFLDLYGVEAVIVQNAWTTSHGRDLASTDVSHRRYSQSIFLRLAITSLTW